MRHFSFANFAACAAAASLACCIALPVHARDAPTRLMAQKLDPQVFQQQLQDTRESIKKEQMTIRPADDANSEQLVIDICKKNPNLPQCRFK